MKQLDVIALGGNAILPVGQAGTIYEQFAITRLTMGQIAEMVEAGREVVVTHGNGPIVGNIVLRSEAMRETIPPMPLGICVADSQGGIGYMIQQVLRNSLKGRGLDRDVVTLVTQVCVDAADPAFANPTKPIGPFYDQAGAEALSKAEGWSVAEDGNRGWRRVVPSPEPTGVVELGVIRTLIDAGCVTITVGGGGIPVFVETGDELEGVEAVVDKDRASALLARELGAERLIVVTSVDAVYRDFGTPDEQRIARMTAGEALELSKVVPAGSMGAKLEAVAGFVQDTGARAVITRPEDLLAATAGEKGTIIYPGGE
jgi:carbamate kinase